MAYRLGIDLGTTNTVASVAIDAASMQLVGLGARSQPTRSMLFLAEDGQLVVGDAASDRGASEPARLIMDPRRQLGTDVPMVVGGQEVTAEQATAELIKFVVGRATAEQLEPPSETTLSHPAHWDEYQVDGFNRAITAANVGSVRLCTSVEAAVAAHNARKSLSEGQRVVVYSLGGGSCEVAVIEKTATGMRILGDSEGADHPSGADLDEAVFRLVLSYLGDRRRHLEQSDPDARRRSAEIKRACTQAKEALSTALETQVSVSLPGYSTTVRLGRQEFASLVTPALRDSISMTTHVLSAAGVQPSDLAAIVLVGGCCRMPIVAELLQREFGVPIALGTHPEFDVALGTLLISGAGDVKGALPVALPTLVEPASAEAAQSAEESPPAGEAPQSVEETPRLSVPEDATPIIETQGNATVIPGAPMSRVTTEATEPDEPTEQLPAVAPTPASAEEPSPVPGPEAPQESMTGGPPSTAPSPSLPAWAQDSAAVPPSGSDPVWSSPSVEAARHSTPTTAPQHPIGQRPPGSPPHGPGPFPSPAPYPPGPRLPVPPPPVPPGPRLPGNPGSWSPNYPGSPPSPYAQWGPGGAGGYPRWPSGPEPGPGGSRVRHFLIIVGVATLVAAAVVVGVLISRRGQPSSTTSPSVSLRPAEKLPSSAAIPESVVVVPMRRGSGRDRSLYLVDTEAKIKRVELPGPGGGNSNPIMQASRNTIIYANAGKLRVMAADGSGDRKLFNRDPAGCARVDHASWSLADPNVLLISCRVSKTKVTLLLVGMDGRLIRKLDTGSHFIGDATLSPDGQTVLYWVSASPNAGGGAFYTVPIIGTGAPKQLSKTLDGVDADPAWSPDGSRIAFRRRVPNGTIDGNEDVFVMNADGSDARAIASAPAADFKPVWSPDNKNLLIISNRKSDAGRPGTTFDLWLVRVTDGKVVTQLGLKAKQITRPFWTLR
jgi:actin-like ATPase involved in cell morphogenesis